VVRDHLHKAQAEES